MLHKRTFGNSNEFHNTIQWARISAFERQVLRVLNVFVYSHEFFVNKIGSSKHRFVCDGVQPSPTNR